MRRFCLFLAALVLAVAPVSAQDAHTTDGVTVPPGFTIEVIAHIPQAREIVVASNGDLIVGTSSADVYIVPEAEGAKPGAAAKFVTVDDAPVAGVTIDGDTMYLGAQFGVYKLPFHAGDHVASAKPVKIASVRTSGRSRDHVTTTVAVTKGVLYASVGSSCNNCNPDLDATRATIQQMHLDGSGMTPKAEHIRNAIALAVKPESGDLWAGVAEQDELAATHPYEKFDDISAHSGVVDYGYPYCYENRKAVDATHSCAGATVARVYTPAYDTPIGATFYPLNPKGRYAFPAEYRGGAFIALHGSWHKPLVPPRVAFVPMNGDEPKIAINWENPMAQWHEFVGGFQKPDESRVARPTGVTVGTDGTLFVSDDTAGNIYRIRPKR
jgi:glucose/arabinose dehydrogenase